MKTIKERYNLVVIGGGPAGTPVAIEYAKLNPDKSVALIESVGKLGGECLFQGCIPSKIMQASARHIDSLKELKEFGVALEDKHYKLVWDKITQRKESILDKRSSAAADVLNTLENLELIQAKASFIDQESIELEIDDAKRVVSFDKAVIGTGSKSFIPRYDGDGLDKIWTNSDFFAKMELPKSLGIIGSGAIAIEFAQILSEFGVEIKLFIRGDKILKNIESEASEYLLAKLQKSKNIELIFKADIQKVDFANDAFRVVYVQENQQKQLQTERLLSAAGRVANIETLNLESAGVVYTKRGITTSKSLQTSNKNIYANGDVVDGFAKFAHTAQYGAHTIAKNLFLEHDFFKVHPEINSWVLFSSPNVMMAGISKEEAQKQGIEVIVDKFEFSTEAKSQIENEDYGYLKFIVEKSSHKIIGISAMHQEAHSLGGEAALIIANHLTLKNIISSIHPHPTISEAYIMLAKQMMGAIMQEKLENPAIKTLLKLERWL